MSNGPSKWAPKAKPALKISQESAEAQVAALLEHYNIDVEQLAGKSRDSAISSFNKLADYYAQGLVENHPTDKAFEVIQHRKNGQSITYTELAGKHKREMDAKEGQDAYSLVYGLMGSLAGVGRDAIEKFEGIDLSVAECLSEVFLLV